MGARGISRGAQGGHRADPRGWGQGGPKGGCFGGSRVVQGGPGVDSRGGPGDQAEPKIGWPSGCQAVRLGRWVPRGGPVWGTGGPKVGRLCPGAAQRGWLGLGSRVAQGHRAGRRGPMDGPKLSGSRGGLQWGLARWGREGGPRGSRGWHKGGLRGLSGWPRGDSGAQGVAGRGLKGGAVRGFHGRSWWGNGWPQVGPWVAQGGNRGGSGGASGGSRGAEWFPEWSQGAHIRWAPGVSPGWPRGGKGGATVF